MRCRFADHARWETCAFGEQRDYMNNRYFVNRPRASGPRSFIQNVVQTLRPPKLIVKDLAGFAINP